MKTTIKKWGNSLGLRLPMATIKDMGLFENSEVDILIKDDCLVLQPKKIATYNLRDLILKISPKNLHKEVDWGNKVGKEVW